MGCTARGGDSIHLKKRLLALIAAAAVLVVSAVAIVSLRGDDKPEITNDVPGETEQPASTPHTVYRPVIDELRSEFVHKYVVHAAPHSGSDDAANDADSGSDAGDNDDTGGSDDQDDQSGSDSDDGAPGNSGDGKKHGLERAIEVHEINLAKKQAQVDEKGVGDAGNGHGLENSLEHLQENLAKHSAGGDAGAELDHGNNGHGQAKGN